MTKESLGDHPAAALDLFRQSIDKSKQNRQPYSWAYWNLGRNLRARGELAEARPILSEGAEVAPDGRVLTALGQTLLETGEIQAAEVALRRAIALEPDYAEARYVLARILQRTGRVTESRDELAAFEKLRTGQQRGAALSSDTAADRQYPRPFDNPIESRQNGRRIKGELMPCTRPAIDRFLLTQAELAQQLSREYLNTGLNLYDRTAGGIPRGAVTEIYGPPTSGKTTFVQTFLANATRQGEFCALVDASNNFDPASACAAGADLSRLLWVRCRDAVQALKSADLLIHSGGWGVVILDLGNIAPQIVRGLPISYWYRFRRAVENTPTAFLVLEREPYVKNCAVMAIEMQPAKTLWSGTHPDFRLLRGVNAHITPRKPVRSQKLCMRASA